MSKKQKTIQTKKLRKLGDIMLDMEQLLNELTDDDKHALQWNEALSLVHGWLSVHAPHAQETYIDDNSHPEFYYGPIRK